VASVRAIEQPGEGSGIGAVAGGVAGGAVGSQFGKGKGQIVGTVIGAVGGAIAGHQVERHVVRKQTQYEVTVRLDDGTTRTIVQNTEPAWRPGDQVRVIGNEIRSAS
jgi:outer membrane lipoprotein SlyB